MYKCKECGKLVLVVPNTKPIKICKCNAAIVVDLESSVKGIGGVKV